MIIGVGAVIAMVAVGQGAKVSIRDNIKSLGANMLIVIPGSTSQGGIRAGSGTITTLKASDAFAIKDEIDTVAWTTPVVRKIVQAIYSNQNWSTILYGSTPEYFSIRQWELESGRFFTNTDVRATTKVAVIGKTVVKSLFQLIPPVGKVIRINRVPFRVIGVLKEKGQSGMGQDQDDVIIIPYTSAQKRVIGITYINQILISAKSEALMKKAEKEVSLLLRERHRILPGYEEDFTIRNIADIQEAVAASTRIMTLVLGSIAAISLVVGGIGIMNIMLVSVTERTREIGIRMAVGAKDTDILFQFLIESLVLCLTGGIIGIFLGFSVAKVISLFATWPPIISLQSILMSFSFAIAIGLIFGLYPARKASLLDPIDALRYE